MSQKKVKDVTEVTVEEIIKKGIFKILTPEQIDEWMTRKAEYLKPGNRKKNKDTHAKWSEAELQIRDSVILDYTTRMGLSQRRTCEEIADRWNISFRTAQRYYIHAMETLCSTTPENIEDAREKQIERLNAIAERALDNNNLDAALRAYEQLNKINSLYTDKKEIAITDVPVQFQFGKN